MLSASLADKGTESLVKHLRAFLIAVPLLTDFVDNPLYHRCRVLFASIILVRNCNFFRYISKRLNYELNPVLCSQVIPQIIVDIAIQVLELCPKPCGNYKATTRN